MNTSGAKPEARYQAGLFAGTGWLLLAMLIIAALVYFGDVRLADMVQRMARMPIWAYGVVALAQAVIIIMAAHRWSLILFGIAPDAPGLGLRDSTAATTLAVLAGQVLPIQVITPLVRAWFARRHHVPTLRAIGSSVFEQLFEVIVLVSMAILAALIVQAAGRPVLAGLAAAAIILVLILAIRPIVRLGGRGCTALGAAYTGTVAQGCLRLGEGLAAIGGWSNGLLIWLSGLSFLRYGLMAALNVGLLLRLAPDVEAGTLLLAFPVVLLVMSLPIFPGGLGVVEVTWAGTLIAAGMTPGAAIEAALSLRIISTAGFFLAAPVLVAAMTPRAALAKGAI